MPESTKGPQDLEIQEKVRLVAGPEDVAEVAAQVEEAEDSTSADRLAEVSEDDQPTDELQVSILEMKQLVGEVSADAGSTISRLDQVQDRLIDNLESLNKRIENYIELLAQQRKSA